jgi:Spy/CpxP family protein refolding chaperone
MLQGPLAMSDDQYEKLYAIKNDVSDSIAPKKVQLHQAMRNLMDSLGQADQDQTKIKGLQSQIAGLKSDISSAELSKMVRMSQVLTPEQRKTLHSAMIKMCVMRGMHGHGHQMHHH